MALLKSNGQVYNKEEKDIIMIDFEQIWMWIVWVMALIVFIVVFFATTTDHRIRGYYMNSSDAGHDTACVYGDITWEQDTQVFCSIDPQKALDFMRQANEGLGKGK